LGNPAKNRAILAGKFASLASDRESGHKPDIVSECLESKDYDRGTSTFFATNGSDSPGYPSARGLELQDRLTEAGKILGLRVLDHVIVSRKGYYSFQEAGLIKT
jgi:DNA repair protein RadC